MGSRSCSDMGYIWPKDPRPGNPGHWPRWWRYKDILRGKGPDIYFGRIRHHPSRRPVLYCFRDEAPDDETSKEDLANENCPNDNCPPHDNHHRDDCRYRNCPHHPEPVCVNPIRDHEVRVYPAHVYLVCINPACNNTVRVNFIGPDPVHPDLVRPDSIRHDTGRATQIANGNQGLRYDSRMDWSLWNKNHIYNCRLKYCDDCDKIHEEDARGNRLVSRHPEERYDFRTRKYQIPDEGTWSRQLFCENQRHSIPMAHWDRFARGYASWHYHNLENGVHRDCWAVVV
ncbi:hypothetical protein BDW59DRAFT_105452 [Aspergillus cavernicola]|uniref:Uncharacterized protein n=1 Tax=Aspergillus cavernicola TaxID=176166 RepID=A0ABR4IXJ0_9EURO